MTLERRLQILEQTSGSVTDVQKRAELNVLLAAAVALGKLSEEKAEELQQPFPGVFRFDEMSLCNLLRRAAVGDDRRFRELWMHYASNRAFPLTS